MKMQNTPIDGDSLIGRRFMVNFFFCSCCQGEVDTEDCVLIDILEKPAGRTYVFECPDCGYTGNSEILNEYQYDFKK